MPLMEKDKEIRKLKRLKEALPFELKEGEKLLTVIFQSLDQKVHYSLICKDSEKFNLVENRLYEVYPQYEERDNCFYVNGNKIKRGKTLKENNIKYGDMIAVRPIDD